MPGYIVSSHTTWDAYTIRLWMMLMLYLLWCLKSKHKNIRSKLLPFSAVSKVSSRNQPDNEADKSSGSSKTTTSSSGSSSSNRSHLSGKASYCIDFPPTYQTMWSVEPLFYWIKPAYTGLWNPNFYFLHGSVAPTEVVSAKTRNWIGYLSGVNQFDSE